MALKRIWSCHRSRKASARSPHTSADAVSDVRAPLSVTASVTVPVSCLLTIGFIFLVQTGYFAAELLRKKRFLSTALITLAEISTLGLKCDYKTRFSNLACNFAAQQSTSRQGGISWHAQNVSPANPLS
ncbi:hypothetical protein [Eilatimonas milleporae]|uniref:hypothetical protein n=1 Tax=Eilatimonas milleporae TaxID=911205 RepID=UPI0011C3B4BF|nr:hypothetical protein [Eilatimonas milleporae]